MQVSYLNERIDELEDKIDILNIKIDKILNLLNEKVEPNCEKMGSHINFVENIYENVKNPLNFFCNKINNYLESDTTHKLEIKNT